MTHPLFASPGEGHRRADRPARLAVCAVLALVACAAPSGTKGRLVPLEVPGKELERGYAPKRLALLVGIRGFAASDWGPLRFSEKDAEDLANVLREPTRGAFDQVEVVKNGPTRGDMKAALERLAAANADERDTVVVYVSSHGTLARNALGEIRRYLVTRETRLSDVANTALPLEELKAWFNALRSRRKVLVLAACHSGGGKSLLPESLARELDGTKGEFFVRPIEEVSRASVVLAASDWGETAREDEKLENDIYTHFFVEALRRTVDRNGDGAVTATEAHDYARQMTYDFTVGRQRPSAESSMVGTDPIVLVGQVQRRGRPELFSYASAWDGFTVRIDGSPLLELPGGVAVEPGKHRVQIAKGAGSVLRDEVVELEPGEHLDLETLKDRRTRRWALGVGLTYMSFLRAKDRADILAPAWGLSATYLDREWPLHRINFRFDVAGALGSGTFSAHATYRSRAFRAGSAFPWRFTPFSSGRTGFEVLVGPRLSGVLFQRIFDFGPLGRQTYGALMPGLMGSASWRWERLTLEVEAQIDYARLKVNGATHSSGLGNLLLGGEWRF